VVFCARARARARAGDVESAAALFVDSDTALEDIGRFVGQATHRRPPASQAARSPSEECLDQGGCLLDSKPPALPVRFGITCQK
jgi:hypothetical protein